MCLSVALALSLVKKRAAKIGRNITKNTAVQIPESYIPAFRPGDEFNNKVKTALRSRTLIET
ncbi:HU family DNA-binding protein [Mucilaginibacter gilvus]|uniref:HU family DNA-binding protein n=1 Tax=Mucilaginibacter gilvus TaxID=2305909 RepID=UPI0037447AC0